MNPSRFFPQGFSLTEEVVACHIPFPVGRRSRGKVQEDLGEGKSQEGPRKVLRLADS